jgi:hypothetical protein
MASHDPPPRTLFPFDAAPDARRAADYAHLIGSVEQRAGFQTHHIVASHAAFWNWGFTILFRHRQTVGTTNMHLSERAPGVWLFHSSHSAPDQSNQELNEFWEKKPLFLDYANIVLVLK